MLLFGTVALHDQNSEQDVVDVRPSVFLDHKTRHRTITVPCLCQISWYERSQQVATFAVVWILETLAETGMSGAIRPEG